MKSFEVLLIIMPFQLYYITKVLGINAQNSKATQPITENVGMCFVLFS